jgi:hypothetical protein
MSTDVPRTAYEVRTAAPLLKCHKEEPVDKRQTDK